GSRRHTRFSRDWSSDVCSSDLLLARWSKRGVAASAAAGVLGADPIGVHAATGGATDVAAELASAAALAVRVSGQHPQLRTIVAEDRKSVEEGDGRDVGGRRRRA